MFRLLAYRNGDRISEFALGYTVTVLFHFFGCDECLTDQFHLEPCLSVRCVRVDAGQDCLCSDGGKDLIFISAVELFDRVFCHLCCLLFVGSTRISQEEAEVQIT